MNTQALSTAFNSPAFSVKMYKAIRAVALTNRNAQVVSNRKGKPSIHVMHVKGKGFVFTDSKSRIITKAVIKELRKYS